MAQDSIRLSLVGAAIKLDDIDRVDGLRDFIRNHDRDVEIQDLTEVDASMADLAPFVERARKIFDGHGGRIGLHGPCNGFTLDTPDPEIRAIVQKRLQAALDACIAIATRPGTAQMVVHSPFRTWDWYNDGYRPKRREKRIRQVHKCLGQIVKRAEDEGVTIVIENTEDKDPCARVELVRSFDSPAVRVSLDTGHAHYAHVATGAPPVDYFVRAAGNLLSHVHLHDGDGFADRHWPIGQGSICWAPVFRALGELPEMPRLILELADARQIQPSAVWLAERELAF